MSPIFFFFLSFIHTILRQSPFSVVLYLHLSILLLTTYKQLRMVIWLNRSLTETDVTGCTICFKEFHIFYSRDTTLTFLLQFSQNRFKPGILDPVIKKGCKEVQWKPFIFTTIIVVICCEPKSSESSMTCPNAVWSICYSNQAAFF